MPRFPSSIEASIFKKIPSKTKIVNSKIQLSEYSTLLIQQMINHQDDAKPAIQNQTLQVTSHGPDFQDLPQIVRTTRLLTAGEEDELEEA